MKLNMKMTLVAGALALAVAGQANAAIVSGATNSSSVVLSIWDTTTLTSYTGVVGNLDFNSFAAAVSGTSTTLAAGTSTVATQTFASNDVLTSYLSGVNMGTTLWSVTAVDNSGTSAFGQKALVTTTNTNPKSAANSLATTQANATLLTAVNTVDAYYTGVGATTPATFTVADTGAYAGTALTTNAKTFLKVDTTAAVGTAMNFWYMTPSSTSTVAKASVAQFKNTVGASTWTLASNGTLTYVAPVPEPGEWLLMLSGLGLIGFIATRRRNNAGSMTFA